jgi:hypothetical protein
MEDFIDCSLAYKSRLLIELVNRAHPKEPFTLDQARNLLRNQDRFECVHGRPIHVSFESWPRVSGTAYDQSHGPRAFMHALMMAEAHVRACWHDATLACCQDMPLPRVLESRSLEAVTRMVLAPGVVMDFDRAPRRLAPSDLTRLEVLQHAFDEQATEADRSAWFVGVPEPDLWLMLAQTSDQAEIDHRLRNFRDDEARLAVTGLALPRCADRLLDHYALRSLLGTFSGDAARLEFLRHVKRQLTVDLWPGDHASFLFAFRTEVARREALEILLT